MKKIILSVLSVVLTFILAFSTTAFALQPPGDVDGDGKLNVNDITLLQKHIAGIESLSESQKESADINGDSHINITDVTEIQRSIVTPAFTEYRLPPYDYEKDIRQEQELDSTIKEEILQKLMDTELADSNPENIVIRYYGKLKNDALLINFYDKTLYYPQLPNFQPTKYSPITVAYTNITFYYDYYLSEKDVINLYINGEIYTCKKANELGLIDMENLFEFERSVDGVYFGMAFWD